jgi:hypothetical protein
MTQLPSNHFFELGGLILTGVSILATLLIPRWEQPHKDVTYDVIYRTKVLPVKEQEQLEGKLEIFYDRKPVKSLTVWGLKVRNSGTLPIQPSDYEKPISFSMGQNSQILSVDTIEADPPELTVKVIFKNERLFLEEKLLNSKDSITFKILVKDAEDHIYPDARIIGVKRIRSVDQKKRQAIRLGLLALLGLVFFFLGTSLDSLNRPPRPRTPMSALNYWGIASMILGGALVFLTYAYMLLAIRKNRSSGLISRRKQSSHSDPDALAVESGAQYGP